MIGKMLAFLALSLVPAFAAAAAASERPAYAEGQVWEYRTRPQDSGSLVRIQKIETPGWAKKSGPIYHVTVIGVHFQGPAFVVGVIGHLPVSRQTLDASLIRLAPDQSTAFPGIEEGLDQWRRDKGGVFTLSLAEIVDMAERTLSQSAPGQESRP
ncbi:MAG: hypothetical protein QOG84_161 [Sphingomonadales bacterium]|jgi:hypothetical protein|nr:hypothetical protein [Sphingomonadales bacterium]